MVSVAFRYRFRFARGEEAVYDLAIDAENMVLTLPPDHPLPSWTALEFRQCPHCPLRPSDSPSCPLAAGLADLVTTCTSVLSHDKVSVEVTTPERVITLDTTAQRAIGSLMGLLIPCSGCPRTAWFRPMARFHLPCATEEETIYRASSMYLLAQYFVAREGRETDPTLAGLSQIYRDIHYVNRAMADRVRYATAKDATVNAVVLLDLFAKAIPFAIDDSLAELRPLFRPYWDPT